MFIVYDSDRMAMTLTSNGLTVANAEGLFGGLPGSCNFWAISRHAAGANGAPPLPLPASYEEIEGKFEALPSGNPRLELERGDMFYTRCTGGGGYGDPLDRDPADVLTDVQGDIVSRDEAERVYGVVLTDGKVAADATARRRGEIRSARLQGNSGRSPAPVPGSRQRIARHGEYVELVRQDSAIFTACRCCGQRLDEAKPVDLPLRAVGPLFPADEATQCVMRITWCPGCGTQLAAQIVEKGSPPLEDIALAEAAR
jgi:N-methylhydantoinase B